MWDFVSAVIVVALGAWIVEQVRTSPPRTADAFANVLFLGVVWFCVFGVVLFSHLKS
jgi:hypothetical protein